MKKEDGFYRGYYLALFSVALSAAALHLLVLADTAFLWTDELFSWWVAVQTSWTGLWQAMYRGSDGMFPAFYVFSWCWSQLFGQAELTLRLPSILFALGGGAICFTTIRRLWGDASACASVGGMILGNSLLLNHAMQFRGYGMLLGFTALSVYWLVAISPDHPQRRRVLGAHAATQLLLCLAHPFGVLYSAALGTGKIFANATSTRRHWDGGLAWSYVPAVLGLLLWMPGLRAVMQLNVPQGWVPAVTMNDLGRLLLPNLDGPWGSAAVFAGLAALFGGGAFSRPTGEVPAALETPAPECRTATILAVAILAVGPLVWVVSLFLQPLLIPRYLIPAAWAWAILGAALWSSLAQKVPRPAQLAAVVVVLSLGIFGLLNQHYPQLGDRTSQAQSLDSKLHKGRTYATGYIDLLFLKEKIPVFMEGIHSFLARDFYNPGKYDYRLVLNQELAWSGRDVKGASTETKLALKLRENGMAPAKILDVREAAQVFEQLQTFYFLDLRDRPTADALLNTLRARGWREETVCPEIPHPDAGFGVIKKFTRPAVSPGVP